MVEVIVGVVKAEDGEVLDRLEDRREGQAGLGGVTDRSRGGAAGEALDVHRRAGVEDVQRLRGNNPNPGVGWRFGAADGS